MQGNGQTGMDGLGTVGTATIIATGPGTATLVMNHPGTSGGGGGHLHPHHGAEVISDGNTSYVSVATSNGGQAYITAEQYEALQAQIAASQQQQHQQQQQQQQHREETEGLHDVDNKEQEASLQVAEQEGVQTETGNSGRTAVYSLPEVSSGRGYSLTTTQNPAEPGIITSTDLNSPPQEEEEEDKDSEEAEVGEDDGKDRKHVGGHVYKTPRGLLLATAAEVLKSSTS